MPISTAAEIEARFPVTLPPNRVQIAYAHGSWDRGGTTLRAQHDGSIGHALILVDTTVHSTPRDTVRQLGNGRLLSDPVWHELPSGMEWGGVFYALYVPRNSSNWTLVDTTEYTCPHCASIASAAAQVLQSPASETEPTILFRNFGMPDDSFFPPIHEITGEFLSHISTTRTAVAPPQVSRRCSNCRAPGHTTTTCTDLAVIDKIGIEIEGIYTPAGLTRARAAIRDAQGGESGDGSLSLTWASRGARTTEFQTNPGPLDHALRQLVLAYPDESNSSCGMHVHVSFRDHMLHSTLMTSEFFTFFRERWEAWGTEHRLDQGSQFFRRLRGHNSYCMPNRGDEYTHSDRGGDRYRQLNFWAWSEHRTVECRLLPMFQHDALACDAVRFLVSIFNDWASSHADALNFSVRSEVTPLDPIVHDPAGLDIDLPTLQADTSAHEMVIHDPTPRPPGTIRIFSGTLAGMSGHTLSNLILAA